MLRHFIHDENGGVDHDANQHQRAEQDKHGDGLAGQYQRPDNANQAHGQGQQNQSGAAPRFQDGRQRQQRQERRKDNGFAEVGDDLAHHFNKAGIAQCVAGGQEFFLFDDLRDFRADAAHGCAGKNIAENLDGAALVMAVDLSFDARVHDIGHGFQRDGAAIRAGQKELADLVLAAFFGQLDANVIGAVAAFIAGGLNAFDIGAHDGGQTGNRQAEVRQNGPLGQHADFRLAVAHGGFNELHARRLLNGLLNGQRGCIEHIEVVASEVLVNLERLSAHASGDSGGNDAVGFVAQQGADFRQAVEDGPVAFGLGFEEKLNLAHIDAFAGLAAGGVCHADACKHVFQVGITGEARLNAGHPLDGLIEVVISRGFDADEDASVIGGFKKGEAQFAAADFYGEEEKEHEEQHDGDVVALFAGDETQDIGEAHGELLEGAIPPLAKARENVVAALAGRLEEQGTQNRREGEAD